MPTYQKIVWIGLAVTALAIIVLGYFLFLAPTGEKKAVTIPETQSLAMKESPQVPQAGDDTDPAITLLDLDLDASDAAVRDLVAGGEIPAAMKNWLQRKEIVRTVVAVVDSIALGQSPAPLLPFMAPEGKFLALERNGVFYLDPRSYWRFDHLVAVFTAVPDKTWITWYKTLRPTLEKAFREMGYPGISFAQRLRQAIEQLLQVPALPESVELEKKVLSYAFVDPNLEELNPAQKHLLRLGPANAARVQKKLRALAALLKPDGKK